MPRPRHPDGHEADLLNRDEIDKGGWSHTLNTMNHPMAYASREDRGAVEIEAALAAAKEDAERVRAEFVDGLPADSLAYDAEWTTRYGSEDRLIFIFSVVLDLDEKLRMRDYPREAVNQVIADLRRRLVGTRVDAWGVWVVTIALRPKPSSDD